MPYKKQEILQVYQFMRVTSYFLMFNVEWRPAQRVVSLTRYRSLMSLSPIEGACCFHEQETLPSLRSTG